MMILTTTGKPKILTGFTKDYGILRKAVDELNPTERTGSIAHALQNARFFQESRPSGAIIEVISDGCFREDAIDSPHQGIDRQETTEGNSPRQKTDGGKTSGHLPPHWTLVGAPAENLAITRFEARRVATGRSDFEIFLKVTNFSEKEAVFDIEIDREGMMVDVLPFTLPPGKSQERITCYTSTEGGILHARIAELRDIDDALPSDDEAFSPLPAQPELNLLYYGEEDHFLYHVLAAQKNVRLTKIDDLPEELPDNSLLILYRELPDNPPRGNLLLVSPQNGSSFLPLGAPLDPSPLELVKPTSPLLQSIRWEEPVEGVREIPTDGRSFDVVAQTAEAPVIFSIPNGSTETIVFNFSWKGADLPLRTLFPILFTNAINRLRGGVSEKGFVIENSRLIWRLDDRDLRPVCVGPDGKGIPVAIDGPDASVLLPDRGGILTVFNEKNEVIHRFALPLSSEEESNLTPNPTLTEASESRQTPSIPARTPTGSILALMGLLLLIGEGYLYQRRWIE